jgi:aminopeptidase C
MDTVFDENKKEPHKVFFTRIPEENARLYDLVKLCIERNVPVWFSIHFTDGRIANTFSYSTQTKLLSYAMESTKGMSRKERIDSKILSADHAMVLEGISSKGEKQFLNYVNSHGDTYGPNNGKGVMSRDFFEREVASCVVLHDMKPRREVDVMPWEGIGNVARVKSFSGTTSSSSCLPR